MNLTLLFPLSITVLGGCIYHFSSKHVPENVHIILVIVATYITAIAFVVLYFMLAPINKTAILSSFGGMNLAFVGIAIGSILIEVGFILSYKAGWDLSNADIFSVTLVTIIFIAIELIFLNYEFNLYRIFGLILCSGGLYLLTK